MNVEELYEILKNSQEPKGYFFNKDKDTVMDLLKGLLTNKARYNYMSCPCRLASDNRGHDMDIICPCKYREPDIKEFGSCYCNLYVSQNWNENRVPHVHVPERRSADKMSF